MSIHRNITVLGLLLGFCLFSPVGRANPVVGPDAARLWRRSEVVRSVGDPAVRVLAVEASRIAAAPQLDEREAVSSWRAALGGTGGVTVWRSSVGEGRVAGEVGSDPSDLLGAPIPDTRRLSQLRLVQDLHFASDGALWIATATGLWRLDPDGRLEDRSPAPGQAARWVHRVLSHSGVVLATTRAGAYVTTEGRPWRRLSGDLPLGEAGALALRSTRGEGGEKLLEVWLVIRGALRRLEFQPSGGAAVSSERLPAVSGLSAGAVPLQILLDWPDAEVALLYENAIAFRAESVDESVDEPVAESVAEQSSESGRGGERDSEGRAVWQIVRPVLPPGAKASWLARAGGAYWLATNRGLLRAAHWRGPWRRASPPMGSAEVFQVAAAGESVLAATGQGLFVGTSGLAGSIGRVGRSNSGSRSLERAAMSRDEIRPLLRQSGSSDPPVRAVQRAALRYLGLGAEHVQDLRRGIRRRGWLPSLSVRLAGSFDRSNDYDYDEAFVSGAMRYLHDRDSSRGRDLAANVTLAWDLGDLAYNPESIDISREARALISLRDDVLDQINQAYYERQALLRALAVVRVDGLDAGPGEIDRHKLQLRADELAAGLDGWTGGWFGKQSDGTQVPPVDRPADAAR